MVLDNNTLVTVLYNDKADTNRVIAHTASDTISHQDQRDTNMVIGLNTIGTISHTDKADTNIMMDLHAIDTISYTDKRYNNKGNIISTPCQMKKSAYAVRLRTDRERWSTWASWAGGSPEPTNSSTVEDVRKGMLSRMDLLPTSRKEKVHRIAVLHEGKKRRKTKS